MECPYLSLPETSWWRHAVGSREIDQIDPFIGQSLIIDRVTRIASAGSCFAQHVSNALHNRGYSYLVAEKAPPSLPLETARRYSYGIFSARYGNIYSTLQLRQLIERALGKYQPVDQTWQDPNGRFFDLLRPRIVPNGFASRDELEADLRYHLSRVVWMFQNAQVFVFTLGLTETWLSTQDGTAYPTCPGCNNAGEFDPQKYRFQNAKYGEVVEHLLGAIQALKEINPQLQIILTVSPVALAATMARRHVLEASVYSKSVLRAAAEEARECFENVHYFPSYELITSTGMTNVFFEADRRSVSPLGVSRAMNCFFRQFAGEREVSPLAAYSRNMEFEKNCADQHQVAQPVVCDEDEFYRALAGASAKPAPDNPDQA
ncbi:MAG TPA: transcription elongation factor GreAB [Verrucomicrobiales bacterium]|nr:transcription elongation factor GreAB [Verrucomicrobiales bacterium]